MARSPNRGRLMVTLGAIAGILPTMWTLVVPVLLVVLAIGVNRAGVVGESS
jgi:hypothetical protein